MTTSQNSRAGSTRQLLSLDYFWSLVRTPETFSLALLTLALVLGLALLMPQYSPQTSTGQTGGSEVSDEWIATLPGIYQSLASLLNPIALFQIFDSLWFWLPVGLIILVSLVVLADYGPFIWQRSKPGLLAQVAPRFHPFHRHLTQTVRAPAPTDTGKSAAAADPLAQLQANLEQAGYQHRSTEGDDALVMLRDKYRWGGPALIMLAAVLILSGLFFQATLGQRQAFELGLKRQDIARLGDQVVQAVSFIPVYDRFEQVIGGEVRANVGTGEPVVWQLHHPHGLDNWWVIPAGIRPIVRINLSRNGGPISPIEPAFPGINQPAYFIDQENKLRFALRYRPSPGGPNYKLWLIEPEAEAMEIKPRGTQFSLPSYHLTGEILIDEVLQLRVYQLSWLGVGLGVLGVGAGIAGLVLLSLSSPIVIWARLLTKGRGSRVSVTAELLRTMPPGEDVLTDDLLVLSNEPDEQV